MMMFVNVHGSWRYADGHFVQRPNKGIVKTFFRDNSSGEEFPEHWTRKTLSEQEKAEFVAQWNESHQARCKAQIAIHPEDKDVLVGYKPMSFDEIINTRR
jgi:hypothetical protein